ALTLLAGDFVLLPDTPGFTFSGFGLGPFPTVDPPMGVQAADEVRHGLQDGPSDMRLLGGHFVFDSPDASLLATLLPAVVHLRGAQRLSVLVRMVGEEAGEERSGSDFAL